MAWYVGSLDQGTTSTRAIFYDSNLKPVTSHQISHEQITPHPGWLQHDPIQILNNAKTCIDEAHQKLKATTGERVPDVKTFGITNQRETLVVWDKKTGRPLYDAVVWCDLRSQQLVNRFSEKHGGRDAFRKVTGLPVSPYFTAFKLAWLMENVPAVKRGIEQGSVLVGTVDTWLLWNFTGNHCISVCNASRTYLMDINKRMWDPSLCALFGMKSSELPRIVRNSEEVGTFRSTALVGVPIAGLIGDQHGASVGQLCFKEGDTKNTYGTGCFLVMNTGTTPKPSTHGLLTTICYDIGDEPVHYALEGSVVQAGMLVSWLKDNMGIVESPKEVATLAAQVKDTGGVSIVPAFAGLFAPHWKPDARGTICGLTMHTKKQHICRAALIAIAMQSVDVIRAMQQDSGVAMTRLKADGGLTNNRVLMQLQSDLADVEVAVPEDKETTALGAAICAVVGSQLYTSLKEVAQVIGDRHDKVETFVPQMDSQKRSDEYSRWEMALKRAENWVSSKL
ncbi:Glycerol kinase [Diplonema papillatum]|nr:Glycerol kinase [Diplonema papillatum]